jgi:hypothetical protein
LTRAFGCGIIETMNRAWMAVAGLVALGAAALWHESPNRPPLLVADSASPGECRAWHERARAQERHRQGWLAIFEGFSTLQGLCHPQDVARGRALIESALASGIDPDIAIDYMMALRKVGEHDAAEEWTTLSAFVYSHTLIRRGAYPVRDQTTDAVVGPAVRAFWAQRPWEKDLADLEHLLSQPAKVPAVESFPIDRLLGRVETGDPTLGRYMRYLAERDSRVERQSPDSLRLHLYEAARCGHPEAIRLQGSMELTNDLDSRRIASIIMRVAWLHQRRTRQEGDLLVALLTKGGSRSWGWATDHMIAHFDQDILKWCRPRRPLGNPEFPGD